jgi:hypothetical protein
MATPVPSKKALCYKLMPMLRWHGLFQVSIDVILPIVTSSSKLLPKTLPSRRRCLQNSMPIRGPHAISSAFDTSSIPIHQLAQATTRPDRAAGFHFFKPVAPVTQLIELVSTPFTSSDTQQDLHAVGTHLAKTVVDVQDVSGFIVGNRLLIPYLFDAVRLLEQGVASRDAIDTAMKPLGCGYLTGPITAPRRDWHRYGTPPWQLATRLACAHFELCPPRAPPTSAQNGGGRKVAPAQKRPEGCLFDNGVMKGYSNADMARDTQRWRRHLDDQDSPWLTR